MVGRLSFATLSEVVDVPPVVVPHRKFHDFELLSQAFVADVGKAVELDALAAFNDGLAFAPERDATIFAAAHSKLSAAADDCAASAVADEYACLARPNEEPTVRTLVDVDAGGRIEYA